MNHPLKLQAGEWVEVRNKEEILDTLDQRGQLEALPFMPEMFQHCGKRFRVFKRAHKTCDPPNGLGGRRMSNAVHLEGVRCDGQAHDGCQAGCLMFWKEAWLKRVSGPEQTAKAATAPSQAQAAPAEVNRCTERDVWAATRGPGDHANSEDPTYVCQSTHLSQATEPLDWWDPRQYLEDFTSGNVRLSQMIAAFLFFVYHHIACAGLGFGSPMRWAYDLFQMARGGAPYPWRMGEIARGEPTPSLKLNLQPGELVRIKKYSEILKTLDEDWKNRGMYYDGEMVPYSNGTFRVLKRVKQIIDEKTGKMLKFKTDAIILQDVVCQARYSKCRRFCPRSIYPYWREVWLERVNETGSMANQQDTWVKND